MKLSSILVCLVLGVVCTASESTSFDCSTIDNRAERVVCEGLDWAINNKVISQEQREKLTKRMNTILAENAHQEVGLGSMVKNMAAASSSIDVLTVLYALGGLIIFASSAFLLVVVRETHTLNLVVSSCYAGGFAFAAFKLARESADGWPIIAAVLLTLSEGMALSAFGAFLRVFGFAKTWTRSSSQAWLFGLSVIYGTLCSLASQHALLTILPALSWVGMVECIGRGSTMVGRQYDISVQHLLGGAVGALACIMGEIVFKLPASLISIPISFFATQIWLFFTTRNRTTYAAYQYLYFAFNVVIIFAGAYFLPNNWYISLMACVGIIMFFVENLDLSRAYSVQIAYEHFFRYVVLIALMVASKYCHSYLLALTAVCCLLVLFGHAALLAIFGAFWRAQFPYGHRELINIFYLVSAVVLAGFVAGNPFYDLTISLFIVRVNLQTILLWGVRIFTLRCAFGVDYIFDTITPWRKFTAHYRMFFGLMLLFSTDIWKHFVANLAQQLPASFSSPLVFAAIHDTLSVVAGFCYLVGGFWLYICAEGFGRSFNFRGNAVRGRLFEGDQANLYFIYSSILDVCALIVSQHTNSDALYYAVSFLLGLKSVCILTGPMMAVFAAIHVGLLLLGGYSGFALIVVFALVHLFTILMYIGYFVVGNNILYPLFLCILGLGVIWVGVIFQRHQTELAMRAAATASKAGSVGSLFVSIVAAGVFFALSIVTSFLGIGGNPLSLLLVR